MNKAEQVATILLDAGNETAKEFILRHREDVPEMSDDFFQAYMKASLWSSHGEDGKSLEGGDLSQEAENEMRKDCKNFWKENYKLIQGNPHGAGHDFWLTRNGYGSGFWDGDWSEDVGHKLTDAAHAYGSQDVYVGDDGLIYVQ